VAPDFTLPPELRDLIDRVRAYVEEDALPAEADVADPTDVLESWDVIERVRDRARERRLYAPQLPEAWGALARSFQDARAARIYDGASEVHRMVVGRDMLELATGGESVRAACGAL
jgi:alkylation response protein AidB-like acyl-CoA dehydrogenase